MNIALMKVILARARKKHKDMTQTARREDLSSGERGRELAQAHGYGSAINDLQTDMEDAFECLLS